MYPASSIGQQSNTGISKLRWLIVAASVFLLTACGFQLRKAPPLHAELTNLSLQCPGKSAWHLCQEAKYLLETSGAKISQDAPYTLTLKPNSSDKRVISIQTDASVAEYEYSKDISFSLVDNKTNHTLIGDTVTASRLFRHNDSALLSQEREQDELDSMLNKQLVEAIVRQLGLINFKQFTTD